MAYEEAPERIQPASNEQQIRRVMAGMRLGERMRLSEQLIKGILEYIEQNDKGDGRPLADPELPDYTPAEVDYHIALCEQDGFITVQPTSDRPWLRSLTREGHEELERLRREL